MSQSWKQDNFTGSLDKGIRKFIINSLGYINLSSL